MATDDTSAPGWDAITNALKLIYGGVEPFHYGVILPRSLGGPDPLPGLSVYAADAPIPHWHYVTYGFSELWEKDSDDPEISGFGFELTLRLRRGDEREPPMFALSLLQNLARYVFDSGNVFGAGDHLPLNGPMEIGRETKIWAAAFVPDPQLGSIVTPFGGLDFLQIVGLTLDELHAARCWKTEKLLRVFESKLPLLVTDLDRDSLLDDPAIAEAARIGSEQDGSSTGMLNLETLSVSTTGIFKKRRMISIAYHAVDDLRTIFKARLHKNLPLTLTRGAVVVAFEPAKASAVISEDDVWVVQLDTVAIRNVDRALASGIGRHTIGGIKDLIIEIRDQPIRLANESDQ